VHPRHVAARFAWAVTKNAEINHFLRFSFFENPLGKNYCEKIEKQIVKWLPVVL
jgi:hypothetical protein